LTVVAVVSNTANVVLLVVTLVVKAGLVENTTVLVPVSLVRAAAKFALDGVAKNVATPVPRPETPVLMGNPVQLVSVPADGVPMFGVTSTGLFENTTVLEPVSSVSASARFALLGVAKKIATLDPRPETPVLIGRPVQLVSVPAEGVPMLGVTSVGLFENTTVLEPVSSVSAVARFALVGDFKNAATPVPNSAPMATTLLEAEPSPPLP
jgi:hypothetical protein